MALGNWECSDAVLIKKRKKKKIQHDRGFVKVRVCNNALEKKTQVMRQNNFTGLYCTFTMLLNIKTFRTYLQKQTTHSKILIPFLY